MNIKRFRQIFERTFFVCIYRTIKIGVGRYYNYRYFRKTLIYFAQKSNSVHLRHTNVGYNNFGLLARLQLQ